jgi:hypothetical protein
MRKVTCLAAFFFERLRTGKYPAQFRAASPTTFVGFIQKKNPLNVRGRVYRDPGG